MDWEYLNVMDKNLLYLYAQSLGRNKTVHFSRQLFDLYNLQTSYDESQNTYYSAERWRKTAYYLIWFVFRYVLDCKTYEQAVQIASAKLLKEYKLLSFFQKRRFYIGVYGVNEIYLYRADDEHMEDVYIVLEILYGRYDFLEQLECFIRRGEQSENGGMARSSVKRCKKVLNECLGQMTKNPRYSEIIKNYNERAKKNEQ